MRSASANAQRKLSRPTPPGSRTTSARRSTGRRIIFSVTVALAIGFGASGREAAPELVGDGTIDRYVVGNIGRTTGRSHCGGGRSRTRMHEVVVGELIVDERKRECVEIVIGVRRWIHVR